MSACVDATCYATIAEAVAAAPVGAVVTVGGGFYAEAIALDQDVTLEAAAGEEVFLWDLVDGRPVLDVAPGVVAVVRNVRFDTQRGRVAEVASGAALTLVGVVANSSASLDQGAIVRVLGGSLRVEASQLSGGQAVTGGQIYVEDGVFVSPYLQRSTFVGGRARNGGAIALVDTDGEREEHELDVTVIGAVAEANGGGAYVVGDDVLVHGEFEDVVAGALDDVYDDGAALYVERGNVRMDASFVRRAVGDAVYLAGNDWSSDPPFGEVVIRYLTVTESAGTPLHVQGAERFVLENGAFVGNSAFGVAAVEVYSVVDTSIRGTWAACGQARQATMRLHVAEGARARVVNSRFAGNATGVSVLTLEGVGDVEVSHDDFVWNAAPAIRHRGLFDSEPVVALTLADNLFVSPRHAGAEVTTVDSTKLVASGNVLWDLGDAVAAAPTVPALEVGVVADPALRGWDADALCTDPSAVPFFDETVAPFPTWFGAGRDAGTSGRDRDGSPPDVGAVGGPDAAESLWTDHDQDGYPAVYDCMFEGSNSPLANPGVEDVPYDGEDVNCDRWSDVDADHDGHDADFEGGDDCDDEDPAIHPGLPEVGGNDVDENCDLELDGDGDGVLYPDDCDDLDVSVRPGLAEDAGPADVNCDGIGDVASPLGFGCDHRPFAAVSGWAVLVTLATRRRR